MQPSNFYYILVCGGRNYDNLEKVKQTLDPIVKNGIKPTVIVQGGALGADQLGKLYARQNGLPCATVDANWDYYGGAAGPVRNEWMVQIHPIDLVVAFPGGKGTNNMIATAESLKIPVIRVIE